MDLTKKVVKTKKLQRIGDNSLGIIIPKKWVEDMDWNQETRLVLEFLPHRKMMILSQDIKPINTNEGTGQRDQARDEILKKAEEEKPDEYDPIAHDPKSPQNGQENSSSFPKQY